MNSIHSFNYPSKKLWKNYKNLQNKDSIEILDQQFANVYHSGEEGYVRKEFLISASHLFYKKNKKIKGYINLNFIGLSYCAYKKSITLFNNDKFFTLFFDKLNILKNWKKIIKKVCILNDIKSDFLAKELLGKGGNSQVYLCKKIKNNKLYAVKTICKFRDNTLFSDKDYQSLINEINIWRSLDHKNVLKVYRIYESKKNFYIITEYCNHQTLKESLEGKLSNESRVSFIKQLIEAVFYFKEKNIVHRDLKPENIFINKSSSNELILKIGDFGLSNLLNNDFIFTRCGTPGYIAPEIINYNKEFKYSISIKVDIYSLGHLIYNILTNWSIYDYEDYKDLIYKNKNNSYELIDTKLDSELKKIIKSCLCDNPKNRINISEWKELLFSKLN